MKIMYIASRHPYPPNKGDQLIAYEQIKLLSKDNDIYLITFPSHSDKHGTLVFEKHCKEVHYIKSSPIQKLLSAFKTLVNKKPFQVNMFTSNQGIKKTRDLCNQIQPDIIHVQTIRMAEYAINLNQPKVIDMIDLMSLNIKRRAEKENILIKLILNIESRLLKTYEIETNKIYNHTILVSKNDAVGSDLVNISINPNGTYITQDILNNHTQSHKEKIILFHGNMNYYPNIQAALYFANEIWPEIHRKYPDFIYCIAGRKPSREILKLHNTNNIVVTGFVEDMVELLNKSLIGAYALKSGTGMQNKILEAITCGLPSVATSISINGLPDISKDSIIIADTKEDIIKAISLLIENEDIRNKMTQSTNIQFMEKYTWDKNTANLKEIYRKTTGEFYENRDKHFNAIG